MWLLRTLAALWLGSSVAQFCQTRCFLSKLLGTLYDCDRQLASPPLKIVQDIVYPLCFIV